MPDPGLTVRDEIVAKTLILGALADWWDRDESVVDATTVQAEAELAEAGGTLAPAES